MKRKLPTLSIAALLAGAIGMSAASPDFPRVTSQFPSWPATAPSQKPHVGGMFGGLKRKNPFRGIACPVVSSDDERHIEGERDTRATYARRSEAPNPFRDEMPIPPPFRP